MKNTEFAKQVVFTCSAVPLAMMLVDLHSGRAGPDVRAYMIHNTGITALVFLLLSLSVTPLRKVTGKNYWSLFRRMLGLYAFFYASVHLLCYIKFDCGWNLMNVVRNALNPGHYFMFYGMAAWLLMVPLAMTSTVGSIKWMGAKRWKWLHRLVYISVSCAAVHFCLFPKVLEWKDLPVRFAFVAAVLLGFRLFTWLKAATSPKPEARLPVRLLPPE